MELKYGTAKNVPYLKAYICKICVICKVHFLYDGLLRIGATPLDVDIK